MRRDDQVAVLAGGERDSYGRRQPAIGTASIEHLAHGADMYGVVLEDLDQSVLEGIGTHAIEEQK